MQATANVLQMTKATTQGEVNVTHILSLEARVPIILFAISFFRQIRQLSRSLRVTPSTFRNMECGGQQFWWAERWWAERWKNWKSAGHRPVNFILS